MKRNQALTIRLTSEEKAKLQNRAKREDRSLAQQIRHMLFPYKEGNINPHWREAAIDWTLRMEGNPNINPRFLQKIRRVLSDD